MTHPPIGMVVDVGEGVARTILHSDFASSGPLAMQMHAALAEPRRRYRRGFAHMMEVVALPECWDALVRWSTSTASLSPFGALRSRVATSDRVLSLATKVGKQIERLASHPAYKGQAVLGYSGVVLPAWQVPSETRLYEPAPTPSRAMRNVGWGSPDPIQGVLAPHPLTVRGRVYTIWHFEECQPLDDTARRRADEIADAPGSETPDRD